MQSCRRFGSVSALLALVVFLPTPASGHCDGMDGPVVKAGQRALEAANVKLALAWVQKDSEAEVTAAFEKTMAVRKLSPEAKELADRYFFETLVRLHRAGEGETYAGLKPAGRDLGPAVPAADKALELGSSEQVIKLVAEAARDGIKQRLGEAVEAKEQAASNPNDVDKARRYVQAYVKFIHYVERVFQAASTPQAHGTETASAADRQREH